MDKLSASSCRPRAINYLFIRGERHINTHRKKTGNIFTVAHPEENLSHVVQLVKELSRLY